jgi:hypothetical protein
VRRWATALLGAITVALVGGCRSPAPEPLPARYSTTQQVVEDRSLPPRVQPTLIKQGAPPLVYMSEGEAFLRFSDLDSGADLASTSVEARQVVSIDARVGIRVGGTTIVPGPLRGEHRYGIWIEPGGRDSSSLRTTTVRPMPQESR